MQYLSTSLLVFVAVCATSCAGQGGFVQPTSGRYMQMKHPATDAVVVQMTVPNPDACAFMLKSVPKNDVMSRLMSCRGESASATLPIRATVRNIPYGFLVDVDAVSIEECSATVDAMVKSGAPNLEIVAPCARK